MFACTAHADGVWTLHQARNLLMELGERAAQFRFPVQDRAGRFTGAFDVVLSSVGIEVVKILPRSPQANAYADRWCAPPGLRPWHLRAVLDECAGNYNQHHPHRDRNLRPPDCADITTAEIAGLATVRRRRRRVLGGLINEYECGMIATADGDVAGQRS